MEIKIIATDMDGTLLDPKGQLDLPRLEKIHFLLLIPENALSHLKI